MMERLLSLGVILPPQTWQRIATGVGCRELFGMAGLRDIRVERKNMGYYLAGADEWWELVWNAGFRRLLQQLQPDALERFRREHLREVAALATSEGIWLDIGVLYTSGTKGSAAS